MRYYKGDHIIKTDGKVRHIHSINPAHRTYVCYVNGHKEQFTDNSVDHKKTKLLHSIIVKEEEE